MAHAETEAGPIDILVNNSGVSTTQRLIDVTADDYALRDGHQPARRLLRRAGSRPSA
jgi:NAD(P)-dependent dehydrogenase (short-subunit alcohol dehydrogenase family)